MANFLSQRTEYNKVQSPVDINLINTVLSAKQGKFDQGLAAIDESLSELGRIDGMLFKQSDREYLANNVKSLLDTVNTSGKLDLSNSGVTRNIQNQIKSALDSKVINAVSQSTKYTNFTTSIAEKAKSKPDNFSEINYQDALERGGAQQWLNDTTGTVELGNLSYSDYIDVAKEQNKLAQEFAKNVSAEQYLGDQSTNLQTVDVYGKRVSKVDLENYITSNLDSKAMNQLQINARQSIGKMSDTNFNSFMSQKTRADNEELKIGIAQAEASLKSMSGEPAKAYARQIAEYKSILAENINKVEEGVFNRSKMYETYTKDFVKGIADNYDIDIITKKDRDNLPYEMMKDERDYQLKLQIAKDKKSADSRAADIATGGTETTRAITPAEETKTDLEKISNKTYVTSNALDNYLKKTDENYAKKSSQEQWAFMLALNSDDPHRKGANSEYKNLVDNFREAQSSYSKIVVDADIKVKEVVADNYNIMIGGSINTANLSSEMPLTARLINSKRKYENLTTSEKSALTAEFATNYIKNGATESDEVNKVYEKIIIKNKAYVEKNSKFLSREISKSANTTKPESGLEIAWSGIKLPYYGAKAAWNATKDLGQYGYDLATRGSNYAGQQIAKTADTKDIEKSWGDLGKTIVRSVAGEPIKMYDRLTNEDSNLSKIQASDLRQDGDRLDVVESFRNLNSSLTTIIRNQAEGYLPNLDTNKAFTFSTADEAQKPTVTVLKAAILNVEGAPIPAVNNDIAISKEGSQFRLDYTTGTGEKQARTSVIVPELPPNIRSNFEDRQQVWKNDPKNPNIRLVPQTIELYKDPNIRNTEARNFTDNMSDRLPIEIRSRINTDPSTTSYATIPEFRSLVKKKYSNAFYEANSTAIENIISSKYKATPFIDNGQFYFKLSYENEQGELMEQTFPSLGTEKDDYMFNFKYRDAASQLIEQRINDLQDNG